MKTYKKRDFPVAEVRRFLEPGPIVLVSTQWKGETNIMTMGWQTVMEFQPSLIGTMITGANYTFDLLVKSKECVISIPEVELLDKVVGIGTTTGAEIDKFEEFELTPLPATKVKAPLIKECYANFECKLHDSRLIKDYNFFIWKVVKAHVAVSPRFPRTFHYRGDGIFMLSGKHVRRKVDV